MSINITSAQRKRAPGSSKNLKTPSMATAATAPPIPKATSGTSPTRSRNPLGAPDPRRKNKMNILLYNPDNGVTRNFMPHLWMFLLQALTPPQHKVHLIDGNAQPLSEADLKDFIARHQIRLVGIGAMTRMAARAYQMADAARAAGALVVMGGPHVTEVPDEPLGRDGGPRHVDAVALGEADDTWPRIVEDGANGSLKEIYAPTDLSGKEIKPSLQDYPPIAWDKLDLSQFDLMRKLPRWARYVVHRNGLPWQSLVMFPIESGRGCPYGCDFCTVTGFFG